MAVHRNRPPGADDGRAERKENNEIRLLYRPDRESRKPPEAGEAPAPDRERLRGHLWQTIRKSPVPDRLEVIRIEKGAAESTHSPKDVKNADILNNSSISRFFRESKFFKLKLGHSVDLRNDIISEESHGFRLITPVFFQRCEINFTQVLRRRW